MPKFNVATAGVNSDILVDKETFSPFDALVLTLGPAIVLHVIDFSNTTSKSTSKVENGMEMLHIEEWYSKSMYFDGKYRARPVTLTPEQKDKRKHAKLNAEQNLSEKPVTCEVFFKWLASIIVITQVPQPSLKRYFQNDTMGIFGNTWMKKMWKSRKEFLHFNLMIRGNIHTVETLLNMSFQAIWIPSSEMVVDETVVPFYGAYQHRVYIPLKPHSTGLKFYEFCDSQKFVYRFWQYKGHQPCATNIALDLVDSLRDTGRTIITDSFYGSTDLANELLKRGLNFFLLCRSDRPTFLWKHVMIDPFEYKPKQWKMKTNGKMCACVFKDKKKHVCALTNLFPWTTMKKSQDLSNEAQTQPNEFESQSTPQSTQINLRLSVRWYRRKLQQKLLNKKIQSGRAKAKINSAISTPCFIQYYNKTKGFVDIADRMIAKLRYPHRFQKWTKASLWAMLCIAIWNSCVIYKTVHSKAINFTDYLLKLVDSIVEHFKFGNSRDKNVSTESKSENMKDHLFYMPFPEKSVPCVSCVNEREIQGLQRRGAKRSSYMCSACGISLCKPCFQQLHNLQG